MPKWFIAFSVILMAIGVAWLLIPGTNRWMWWIIIGLGATNTVVGLYWLRRKTRETRSD